MPFKPQISEPAVFGMLDLDLENQVGRDVEVLQGFVGNRNQYGENVERRTGAFHPIAVT